MAIKQPSVHPIDALNNAISDIVSNINKYKKNPTDFTRCRKLPIDKLIKTTLNMQGQSIEAELLKAYPDFNARMTKSAYEQAKSKITPQLFQDLFKAYNDTLENPKTLDLVKSYRVFAVDGSDFNPPYQEDSAYIVEHSKGQLNKYGKERKPYSQVHGNFIYDILNNTYIDALVEPEHILDERSAMLEMANRIDHSQPFIIIADRGYEGFNVVEHLNHIDNCHYIIRAKMNKNVAVTEIGNLPDKECDKDLEFTITTSNHYYKLHKDEIPHLKVIAQAKKHYKLDTNSRSHHGRWDFGDQHTVKYRVVKFRINDPDTGSPEWEVLITNLNRFEFPIEKMKEMYHMRWDIETSFRNLKYAIGAIQFHSRKDDFIIMELFANFTMYNMVSRCINATSVPATRSHKHTYAIEFKMAVAVVRQYFRLHWKLPLEQLYNEILQYRVPVRPNRKDTRKTLRPKSAVWFVYRVA